MTNTYKPCKIGLGGDNMFNNYKIYKDARNASWQFLIDPEPPTTKVAGFLGTLS